MNGSIDVTLLLVYPNIRPNRWLFSLENDDQIWEKTSNCGGTSILLLRSFKTHPYNGIESYIYIYITYITNSAHLAWVNQFFHHLVGMGPKKTMDTSHNVLTQWRDLLIKAAETEKWGVPKMDCFIRENPTKMHDFVGVPPKPRWIGVCGFDD